MKRGHEAAVLDALDDRLVNQDSRGELLAAVHHAVAHGGYLLKRGYGPVLGMYQGLQDEIQPDPVVGNGFLDDKLRVGGLVLDPACGKPDPLDEALGEKHLVLHFEELEFDG